MRTLVGVVLVVLLGTSFFVTRATGAEPPQTLRVDPAGLQLAMGSRALGQLGIVNMGAAHDITVTVDPTQLKVTGQSWYYDPAAPFVSFPLVVHLGGGGSSIFIPFIVGTGNETELGDTRLTFHLDDGVSDSIDVHVIPPLTGAPQGPIVVPRGFGDPSRNITEGDDVVDKLTLQNPSSTTQTFHVWVDAPKDAEVSISPSEVTIPSDYGFAVVNITFHAVKESGRSAVLVGTTQAVALRSIFDLNVTARRAVVTVDRTSVWMTPNGTAQVNVSVTNPSEATMNATLSVLGGEGPANCPSPDIRYIIDCSGPQIAYASWQNKGDVINFRVPPGATVLFSLTVLAGADEGNTSFGVNVDSTSSPGWVGFAQFGIAISAHPPAVNEPVAPSSSSADASTSEVRSGSISGIEIAALAAATVGAAAIVVAATRRRWPLVGAALYARFAPARLLEHPARARLRALVETQPGITVSDAERASGLSHGAFAHHLQKLEDGGLLLSSPDGQMRRLFVPGAEPVEARAPMDERIVELVARSRGPTRPAALARELGASRQAVHYHVKRLVRDGRLVAVDGGRVDLPTATAAA